MTPDRAKIQGQEGTGAAMMTQIYVPGLGGVEWPSRKRSSYGVYGKPETISFTLKRAPSRKRVDGHKKISDNFLKTCHSFSALKITRSCDI